MKRYWTRIELRLTKKVVETQETVESVYGRTQSILEKFHSFPTPCLLSFLYFSRK